jgi:hypothetical protein
MPSAIYATMRAAIRARRPIICIYRDHARAVCPHILGYAKDGREAVFVFQFAGSSSRGLPRDGAWRCFYLDEVRDMQAHDGPWRAGTGHSRPQQCVQFVDVDVNIPETLKRARPLAFGSAKLRPPRGSKS